MNRIIEDVTKELLLVTEKINQEEIENFANLIVKSKRIFCAGCGRSGLIMRTFAMRLMHLGLISYFVGEVTQPSIREGDLLIIGSSSGKTSSMLSIAERSKRLGAKVALLTSSKESPIANVADSKIVIPSKEIKESVQPDGNLFEQSLFVTCDTVAITIKNNLGIEESLMDYNHTNLE